MHGSRGRLSRGVGCTEVGYLGLHNLTDECVCTIRKNTVVIFVNEYIASFLNT